MGVPDDTYFGEKPEGGGIKYGGVRAITNDQRKLELLKTRLDVLLIKQTSEIAKRDEEGKPIIWSPFSLCVLTLLSIETLGRVLSDMEKIKKESDFEQSKKVVTPIYRMMDKDLDKKPSKGFYKGFELIHGTSDKKSIKKYSHVIHKYQRNTFNHGYQAKGVYLDHTGTPFWQLMEKEGFMVINPYLFWDRFVETFNSAFEEILNPKDKKYRTNALKFFHELIWE